MLIDTPAAPRALYAAPGERAVRKQIDHLDRHVQVRVEAAYLHCAKAFMRSKLWDPAALVERETMPTIGQMIADQSGLTTVPETREEMVRRYRPDL